MKTWLGIVCAALALALASPGASAQTDKNAVPAPKTPAPAPAATASEDVDAVQDRARELGEVGAKATELRTVTPFLQREEESFASRLQHYLEADQAALGGIFVLELREARTSTTLSLNAVRDRRHALSSRIAQLGKASDELDSLRDEWTKRLAAERERGAPPALLERTSALLDTINQSRTAVRARSQALLDLDNRLAALQDKLGRVADRLAEAQRLSQRRLFRLAEPPLWSALLQYDSPRHSGVEQLRAAIPDAWDAAGQFWENYSDRAILHLVVLALLIGAMASLSLSPALRALEAQSGAIRVLKRPISSAVVIALFMSPMFYPGVPLSLGAVMRLVSLVPVARLIPTFVSPEWRALFYFVAGLFGLDTVLTVLPEGTALSRLVLLAMSGAALWVATVGVRRPFAHTALHERSWAGLLRLGLRIVRLLLIVAIVANVLGATRLTQLINMSVVAPAYLGIALAAVVFAINDFMRLLPHARMMQGVRSVVVHRERILQRVATLTRWGALIMWGWLTLRVLGLDASVIGGATQILAASTTLGTFELSLGKVILFLIAVWIAVLVARLTSFVLDHDVLPRMRLARGLPDTISTFSRYLIIGLGLLIAASMAGVDLTQITLILGALSVGIGFGLQNIVNNFISGIILLFERPIQVGDTVQVGDLLGVVRGIGIRASNVRTYGGAEVIVPNSELVSGQVINWTLSDRYRRLELDVGVAYGNRPADVIRVLEDVIEKHEGALKTPAPFVRFRGFGDSSLDFRVYVWVDYDEGLRETSAILSAIYDALAEAGIEIPFPQRDLHLRSVSEAARDALQGKTR
ncbi:MAG: mechanosensitive ion channel domain-containing protein [Burkholderiales bacterium]